jgi:poly(3-hydroxybutyrate) depolymerase
VHLVQVPLLLEIARKRAAAGLIDDPRHLQRAQVYLYRGTKDLCYNPPSVNHTEEFFAAFGANTTFEASVGSLHSIPTIADGTRCGTEGNYSTASPHGLEACGYDGAGACLQHIYRGSLAPPVQQTEANLFPFNQTPFGMTPAIKQPWKYGAGLDDVGYIYIPTQCQSHASKAHCKLHIFMHGCGMQYTKRGPGGLFGLTYVLRAGFNHWAEANNIVVLYPQKFVDCNATQHRPCTGSFADGCWDQAGGTGDNFSDKEGVQVRAIWAMIQRLVAKPSE